MIEFAEAAERVFQYAATLGTARCPVEAAAGFALAEDVKAAVAMAPFRNSAMDGFAVKSEWLRECAAGNRVRLPFGETVFAGDGEPVAEARPMKVMTGAMVPDGFDSVVPFEETEYDSEYVSFSQPIDSGANVRPSGEDFGQGQVLMKAGQVVRATDAGVLAAAGNAAVQVYRRPTVRIVGTGNELIPPGGELRPGQTYDINTFTLQALTKPWSNRVVRVGCVPDDEAAIRAELNASEPVIVTSGGVSAGERDLIVGTAESCGWETVFHKVSIKPGKPVYFAVRNGQLLFGLPGNPLSAAVTCAIFVVPALKKITGRADYRLTFEPARLAPGESRRSGRTVFWPGRIAETEDGLVASYSPKRSSAAISALLDTDGLIVQSSADDVDEMAVSVVRWAGLLNNLR